MKDLKNKVDQVLNEGIDPAVAAGGILYGSMLLVFIVKLLVDGIKSRPDTLEAMKYAANNRTESTKEIAKYFIEQIKTTTLLSDDLKKKYLKTLASKIEQYPGPDGVSPEFVFGLVRDMVKNAPNFVKSLRSDKILNGMYMKGSAKYKKVRPDIDPVKVGKELSDLLNNDFRFYNTRETKAIKYFTVPDRPQMHLGTITVGGYTNLHEPLSALLNSLENRKDDPELKRIYDLAFKLLNYENSK